MNSQLDSAMSSPPPSSIVTPPPDPSSPAVTYVQPKTSKWPLLIVSFLFLLASAAAVYFYLQSRPPSAPAVTNTSSPAPITSADPTAGWQTYSNPTHLYTFRYPADWSIAFEDTYQYSNVQVSSPADKSVFAFHFTGKPGPERANFSKNYIIDDNNYIQLYFNHCADGPGLDCEGAKTAQDITTFTQILSTFKFNRDTSESNPLSTIIELTKPIEWSAPIQGNVEDRGQTLSGQLITTTISQDGEAYTANYNKLGMLLFVTGGSVLTDNYYWVPVMDGFADAPGKSIGKFLVDGKTVITRADNGTYTVFVAD